MADYSLVLDAREQVCGFWFRDVSSILQDAQRQDKAAHAVLRAAAVKHDLSTDTYAKILAGDYRIVPNTFDEKGGYFVMIGSALAPGE